ncbi:MAG TPA: flagellar hook-associated protein FlgL [Longimicrobiaceae bacterium]|nr:flagellar hook-associated protein FlgL [Longimicrobiaceae bacterium]
MRITNSIIQQRALASMQMNLTQIAEAQSRVTTGLRIQQPSDDPAAAASAMRARSSIRALDQYRSAINVGNQRAAAEEGALDSITSTLVRAKELAITQMGGTSNADTRKMAQAEVEHLLRHAVSLANTRFGETYLFAGGDSSTQPYAVVEGTDIDFSSTTPSGEHKVEISAHQLILTNHNGVEVFEDTGVLASLRDLAKGLGANDPAAIKAATADIDSAFDEVQSLIGDVGARVNQLQVTSANLDAMEINLLTFKSDLEEVDVEKAITELVSRQTAFQAAMLATSRVMGLTLADYLR